MKKIVHKDKLIKYIKNNMKDFIQQMKSQKLSKKKVAVTLRS